MNQSAASQKINPYYIAQDILSRRDHSERELREKLQRKKIAPQQIEEIITRLYSRKLLNDQTYAQKYIEAALRQKPVGPKWLTMKLQGRGVRSEVIQQALETVLPSEREEDLVREATEKWQNLHREKQHDKTRIMRFLMSRGFSMSIIQRVISNLEIT